MFGFMSFIQQCKGLVSKGYMENDESGNYTTIKEEELYFHRVAYSGIRLAGMQRSPVCKKYIALNVIRKKLNQMLL